MKKVLVLTCIMVFTLALAAFAGGFMGHLDHTKNISFENMKTAIIVGSAMASFCVEKFGPQRLKEISRKDIDKRLSEFVQLSNFDISLV